MVKEISALTLFFKRTSILITPAIVGSVIFADWYHTHQLKTGKKESILYNLIGPEYREIYKDKIDW
jgi:hypothetical protein